MYKTILRRHDTTNQQTNKRALCNDATTDTHTRKTYLHFAQLHVLYVCILSIPKTKKLYMKLSCVFTSCIRFVIYMNNVLSDCWLEEKNDNHIK